MVASAPVQAEISSHQPGTMTLEFGLAAATADASGAATGRFGLAGAIPPFSEALEGAVDETLEASASLLDATAGGIEPVASCARKAVKKSSDIFLATLSIKREPTCASLPPTSAVAM